MNQQLPILGRRKSRRGAGRGRILRAAFEKPAAGTAAALEFPGFLTPDDSGRKRTLLTGLLAFLLHGGAFGFLLITAALAPVIKEQIIEVQILKEEPPPPPEPAAAPKALAERRSLNYAPALQAVQPQIINPNVIAEASPAVRADALQMDAVSAVTAPTQIHRSHTVVDRVSAVDSVARARATAVDVKSVTAPRVRGPVKVEGPVGPSVGPRKVEAATVANTFGTARIQIGSGDGSSVREGVLSNRDVVGSPDGVPVVSVDTQVGDSYVGGPGGTGTGTATRTESQRQRACFERPEVLRYLDDVKVRTIERWVLPPGVGADLQVKLRFRLDAAGSPTSVNILAAGDNALGASAVDALRSASPFPPMPESARCLSRVPITATFSNPVAG
jgi:TonB family protein